VSAAAVLCIFVAVSICFIVPSFTSDFGWSVPLRVARVIPLPDVLVLIRRVGLFLLPDIAFIGRQCARLSLARLLVALRLSIRHLPSPHGLIAKTSYPTFARDLRSIVTVCP
jgi:hypothetical protein